MAIKDLLVHLDGSPRSEVRLGVAARLAARHGAHLTALHVISLPRPEVFYGFPSSFMDVEGAGSVLDLMRTARLERAAAIKANFTDRLRRDGLAGEWRMAEGPLGETVALHALYADLVVVGQPERDGSDTAADSVGLSPTELIMIGRPVLMVPFAGSFDTLGTNVLVGWNATPEAARAVNDALPLLEAANKVTVLAINPRGGVGGDGDVPAADIALHLARHGVNAVAAHTVATGIAEGDALLSYAADMGADLLVCGMYGHSRLREAVFGGVTRSLLTEMTVPVFMTH